MFTLEIVFLIFKIFIYSYMSWWPSSERSAILFSRYVITNFVLAIQSSTEDEHLQSLRAAVWQFSYPSRSWACSLRWPIREYCAKKEEYLPQCRDYKRLGNESWTRNGHRQLYRVFFNLPWRHSVNRPSFVFFLERLLKNNVSQNHFFLFRSKLSKNDTTLGLLAEHRRTKSLS